MSMSHPLRPAAVAILAALAGLAAGPAAAADAPVIGLITKTETNPFFVKMKEGAQAAAKAKGAQLLTARGQDRRRQRRPGHRHREHDRRRREGDPDHAQRLEGDRAGDQEGAGARRHGHRARQPDRPAGRHRRAVRHRQLQGRPADRPVREGRARRQAGEDRHARPVPGPPGRRAAPQRLPEGLRPRRCRREGNELSAAPQVVCMADSYGDQAKGQTAMENCLQKNPDINLVYTINEPAAAGAYQGAARRPARRRT